MPRDEVGDTTFDGRGIADDGTCECLFDTHFLDRRPVHLDVVDWRRNEAELAAAQVDETLLQRREQASRFIARARGDDVEREHRVRLRETRRRFELATVKIERLRHRIRREMRGERVRQTEHRGEARAEQAGAENPHRHVDARAGHRAHGLSRFGRLEVTQQFDDVVRKRVRTVVVAAQRARRRLIRARSAADAEVDASRIQRCERAELLGDLQRRIVRQHDAAGADADRRRAAGDVADQHRRRRARDAGHVVMLGEPVARVA